MLFAHLSYKTLATSFNLSDDENSTIPYLISPYLYETRDQLNRSSHTVLPDYLQLPQSYNLPDLLLYIIFSIASSELTYHLICGFLQVYFYMLKREEPEKWKCQPHRFLTQSNERHEIFVGTINMFFAGGITCMLRSMLPSTIIS